MRAPLCSKMQRAAQRRPRHDAGVGSRSRPSLSDRSGATYSSVSRALREMAAPHEDSSGARLCPRGRATRCKVSIGQVAVRGPNRSKGRIPRMRAVHPSVAWRVALSRSPAAVDSYSDSRFERARFGSENSAACSAVPSSPPARSRLSRTPLVLFPRRPGAHAFSTQRTTPTTACIGAQRVMMSTEPLTLCNRPPYDAGLEKASRGSEGTVRGISKGMLYM